MKPYSEPITYSEPKKTKKMWAKTWDKIDSSLGRSEGKGQKTVKRRKEERRLDISLREYAYR